MEGGLVPGGEGHGHGRCPEQHRPAHARQPRGPLREREHDGVHARPTTQGLRGHRHLPGHREQAPQRGGRDPAPDGEEAAAGRAPRGARLPALRPPPGGDAGPCEGAGVRLGVRGRPPLERGLGRRRRGALVPPPLRVRPGPAADRDDGPRRARRSHREAAPRRVARADPAASLRAAHRPARPGRPQDHARGRLVLGHRRGPDGPDAEPAAEEEAGSPRSVLPGRPAVRRGRGAARRPRRPDSAPDVVGELDEQRQLGLLLVDAERVALRRRGEAALR